MKIWVITDTHFNHYMLEREGHRPEGVKEIIIENWARSAASGDMTIHLGDVIFKQASELGAILGRIPGKKILVRGNHDRQRSTWFMGKGFDFVCNYFMWKHCLFSHKPMAVSDDIRWNIHGHFHDNDHRFWEPEVQEVLCDKHLLLAIEEMNYGPVLLEDILNSAEKHKTIKRLGAVGS